MAKAMLQRDYRKVLQYLPKEMFRASLTEEELLSQLENAGSLIRSITVGRVEQTAPIREELLVIVPVTQETISKDAPVRMESYWVGVSKDSGLTWRFIEGSYVVERQLTFSYPDLNGKVKFPQRRQVIEKPNEPAFVMIEVNGEWTLEKETNSRIVTLLTKDNRFVDQAHGLLMQFPKGWEQKPGTMPMTLQKAEKVGSNGRVALLSIEVVEDDWFIMGDWPKPGNAVFERWLQKFPKVRAQLLESGLSALKGGNATWVSIRMLEPFPMIGKIWHFRNDRGCYRVAAMASDRDFFNEHQAEFHSSLESFRFIRRER